MIYIVEDDRNIQEIELFALKNSGYQATGFETAKEFYKALNEKLPELILLDIMLPDEDGLSILKRLRSRADTQKIPVILVTAKTSEIDKVKGLDGGADDYIAKPFGVMEMIARSLAGVFLVPALGYFGAALGSPLAWVAADIFLVPAYFRCRRVLMSQSHHLHVKAEEGEL